MTNILDIRDNLKEIRYVVWDLSDITRALDITGNYKLANELREMSCTLLESCDKIKETVSAVIDQDYKNSVESSKSIVMAALSGTKLERN